MRIKIIISTFILLMILMFSPFLINDVFADQPPDPGTGGPGTGDIPVGGGSPIDGGLIVLISLGITYGFKKVYKGRIPEE
ncbi:MAG: hypothetical protein K8R74_15745 [Bacteroidales bacterium]|nr:hypothetical protein [Bacteroidales bacterium]